MKAKCEACQREHNGAFVWTVCSPCARKLIAAAIADGYTVADGQVWKPNPDAENCDNEYCTTPHNKLIKAGGGGT